MDELSNIAAVTLLYFFIFVKFLLFSDSYYDLQFWISTFLMAILFWLNKNSEKYTKEVKDFGKFLGHSMFISICFSLICNLFSMIYNFIFYFGFVNTIIIVNIVSMILMSGLVNLFKEQIYKKMSKSIIGSKLLSAMNYYYNTFIVSKKIYEKIGSFIKYLVINYVWVYTKKIINKFLKINSELADNSQSETVKNKFDNKCSNAKNYFIEQVIQPYFIKSFQDALENDPFSVVNLVDNDGSIQISNVPYKNNLPNKNINMSFLSNTNITKDILMIWMKKLI